MDNYAGAIGNTNQALPPFPTFIRRAQEHRAQEHVGHRNIDAPTSPIT